MAIESVDITEGVGTPIAVDVAAEGAVQITKLAMSADGSSTPVPADADGMLVNLGTNNDVIVTGEVTIDDATPIDVNVTNAEIFVSVNNGAPIPVAGAVTVTSGNVTVDGTVAIDDATPVDVAITNASIAVTGTVTVTDGSGSLTVDGTVTANLAAGTNNIGDVDVLSLPALPAGTNNIGDVDVLTLPALVASSANIGDVDVLTVPAPLSTTGGGTEATALRVTLASNSTGVVAVTDNSSSLSVDWNGTQPVTGSGNATGALRVELPTNGTGIVGLAAGTNGIGKLTSNDGVDIGNVDVASVVPGTGATNLGKAEDSGHTTGDVGVMTLGVRNDADASFGADLDYTPVSTDAGGNQNVRARKDLVRVSVQSGSLTTSITAYTAGDQLGSQFTFAGCARASGGGGMIVGVMVVSAADIIGPVDVVFTDSSITLASDNAAYAISDADALKLVALVNCAANYDIGNNRIAQAFNLAIPYVCSGGTSLYAGLITRAAHTFFAAATDIQVILYVERN